MGRGSREWGGRSGEGVVGREEWGVGVGRSGEWGGGVGRWSGEGVGSEEPTRHGHEALPRGPRLPLLPSEVHCPVPNNVHNSFVTARQADW